MSFKMSHSSLKHIRILAIYFLFLGIIIASILITKKSTRSSSDMADLSSQSPSETSASNNETISSSAGDTSNVLPFDTSNTGNGIGGGAIIGNCSSGSRSLPIYCVDIEHKQDTDTSKKYVSISFDAAWGDEDTIRILDILDKYNIKTTFFMTGGWVDSYPDKVLEIYNRGHDLGNHSHNHKEMSKLSVSEQQDEIMYVADKIKEITGYDSFLFRPPYGDYNTTLINTVYGCNFYPIEWDVDSLDWKDYGTDNIVKTVVNHKALKNGSIILMHNGAKYTADALESVITGLQSKGYEIVPISQLIITQNFHMDSNGMQIQD